MTQSNIITVMRKTKNKRDRKLFIECVKNKTCNTK